MIHRFYIVVCYLNNFFIFLILIFLRIILSDIFLIENLLKNINKYVKKNTKFLELNEIKSISFFLLKINIK